MSGLGLLATAFGSYASTLGGLYKEQVEKEQAAQEKLAAEERQRAWEREKIAGERQFAIEMLQRKFDQSVQLMDKEHELQAKLEATKHQQDLERIGYEQALELKKQEELKRLGRRDALARLMMAQGSSIGTEIDPENMKLVVDALAKQLNATSKMIENARSPEEKQAWINEYRAIQQKMNGLLGLGNAGGTPFSDPNDIVNWLANE